MYKKELARKSENGEVRKWRRNTLGKGNCIGEGSAKREGWLVAMVLSGWATAGRGQVRGGEAGAVGRGLGIIDLFVHLSGISQPLPMPVPVQLPMCHRAE